MVTEIAHQEGVERVVCLLPKATVHKDMNDFSILIILKSKLQKFLKHVQKSFISHYCTKYVSLDIGVHSLVLGKF